VASEVSFKKLEMHNFLNSLLVVILVLLFFPKIFAQNFTVSGTLKDASNGEDLIGATVFVKEKPGTGAAANTYGFTRSHCPRVITRSFSDTSVSKTWSKNSRLTATCDSTRNWPPGQG